MFDKKAYNKEYRRMCTESAKKAGICVVCLKRKAIPHHVECEYCSTKRAIWRERHPYTQEQKNAKKQKAHEKWERLKSEGVCPICGKKRYKDKLYCYDHFIKRKRNAERAKERKYMLRIEAETKLGKPICTKCLNPALEGKKLCKRHYDILVSRCTRKANEAIRRILAEAIFDHNRPLWQRLNDIVLRKRNEKDKH